MLDAVSIVFDAVCISGNPDEYVFLSKSVIEDSVMQKEPAGGIFSGLEYCKSDIFVCSCDMPFISLELIEEILKRKMVK